MTIDELIEKIFSAKADSIGVKRTRVISGNADGSGNRRRIEIDIDGQVVVFHDPDGKWIEE